MNSHLEQITRARLDLDKAETNYRTAIAQANANGYSVRRIAKIVGVSHGTIHTIVKTERNRP